ncbi:hypothetical protein [Blastopirellula marina]|uniref:Uncharacterized protein n=1 Tax=Blastopirellula marina DSM 3645 TaxID=314230 RepID=A4A0E3_9BACT|nr:hypothetical protein [Blastopirellula marina]EAQ77763.1 hypothetical protein DSM3645_25377 [Blastopirellula marina DSM 3645]
MIPFFLFLILLSIVAFVALAVTNYRDLWVCSLFLQVVIVTLLSPGDGGIWARHVAIFFGSLNAVGWLLRNDLGPSTAKTTNAGWWLRMSVLTAPIVIAVVYTVVLEMRM